MRIRALAVVSIVMLAAAISGCSSAGSSSAPKATAVTPATGATGATGVTTSAHPPSAAAAVPVESPGCRAGAALPAGAQEGLTVESGGLARSYRRFVPPGLKPGAPAPLVLNLHGLNSPVDGQVALSEFEPKAAQVGAIVLSPLGGAPGPAWNASRYPGLPDDVAFIAALISQVEQQACIDMHRVYVMGMSNGSEMASQLACSIAGRIAAIATVSGLTFPPGCHPSRSMPIIAFHGTADPDLAFEGGLGPSGKQLIAGLTGSSAVTGKAILALDLAPIPQVAAKWATTVDHCSPTPTQVQVTPHVQRRTFSRCQAGTSVVLYVIAGGGHTWPGSAFSQKLLKLVGFTTMEINADDLIWSFFQQHPLPG